MKTTIHKEITNYFNNFDFESNLTENKINYIKENKLTECEFIVFFEVLEDNTLDDFVNNVTNKGLEEDVEKYFINMFQEKAIEFVNSIID